MITIVIAKPADNESQTYKPTIIKKLNTTIVLKAFL